MRPAVTISLVLLAGACTDELATMSLPVSSGWDARGDRGVGAIGRDGVTYCSGTLIAPRVVLTAAHCLGTGITVDFGGDPIPVFRQAAAPGYSEHTFENDVAVLELARAPAGIRPVAARRTALPPLEDGLPVRIVGFGHTGADGDGASGRREGTTTLFGIDGGLVYTGPGPSQTCHGDSGGPGMMIVDGEEVVVGVMSTTDPSCRGWATLTRIDVHWDDFVAPFVATSVSDPLGDDATCVQDRDCWSGLCAVVAGVAACASPCEASCGDAHACDTDDAGRRACLPVARRAGAVGAPCAGDADCDTGFCDAEKGGGPVCTHRCTTVEGPGCGGDLACVPTANGDEACFPPDPASAGCTAGGRSDGLAAPLLLLLVAARRGTRLAPTRRP